MYRWHLSPPSVAALALAGTLGVHPLIAQVLCNRGIADPETAERFLRPQLTHLHDPFLLPDMDVAVTRLERAMHDDTRIAIYGDYDVDGTCGTAMLVRFFRALGCSVDTYIPHREREGYGMHRAAIDALHARGTQIILTVDTGTTAHESIQHARALNIDVIVTDHHEVDTIPPAALAVINPKRADHAYPFRELCGTGVAFKLMMALRQRLRHNGWFAARAEPNLRAFLDLVAVATVADIVPLVGENRTLASIGLQQLIDAPQCGLRALMRVASVARAQANAYTIGFQIGPRINAAGRMAHAQEALDLLLTDDAPEAERLAKQLNGYNVQRQQVENEIRDQVTQRLAQHTALDEQRSIVLGDPQWPAGVVGIVASRIAETYRMPTILVGFSGEIGKGSARTVGRFPLLDAIRAAGEHLEAYGGHAAAAGVTVRQEKFAQFVHAFESIARDLLQAEHRERLLHVDAELRWDEITLGLAEQLAALEPFGLGNPTPLFLVCNVPVQQRRIVGKNHLQLQFLNADQIIRAIGFTMGDHPDSAASPLDIICTPTPNTWNGSTTVQLKLRDLRKSSPMR